MVRSVEASKRQLAGEDARSVVEGVEVRGEGSREKCRCLGGSGSWRPLRNLAYFGAQSIAGAAWAGVLVAWGLVRVRVSPLAGVGAAGCGVEAGRAARAWPKSRVHCPLPLPGGRAASIGETLRPPAAGSG